MTMHKTDMTRRAALKGGAIAVAALAAPAYLRAEAEIVGECVIEFQRTAKLQHAA